MMTIRSMTATFGKLNGAKLTCADGLNLIHAPNEGGKSTWCAFYKAMLFGIDTRDRDKKGHLAEKNHYQPWSGAPMEGEMVVDFKGRTLVLRRFQKGSTPFGGFSATYADSGEAVPGLTAANCGETLTGVTREVFERSAFIGGSALPVTPTPELERRITALLTAGQEEVSFSQTQTKLKEWLNRRRVNRSVGLIPKLEEELAQASADLTRCEEHARQVALLEAGCARLRSEKRELEQELDLHRRLSQKDLNARFAQADEEYRLAKNHLDRLERELSRFERVPSHEELKEKQFELQYLKVLDEEIKAAQADLERAEEDYTAAREGLDDSHFPGMTGAEARQAVTEDRGRHQTLTNKAARLKKWTVPLILLALPAVGGGLFADFYLAQQVYLFTVAGGGLALLLGILALVLNAGGKKALEQAGTIPLKYGASSMEELTALLTTYENACAHADACAEQVRTIRGALNDRLARKENSRADLFTFVHTFAPEVKELFGCSAAISRALNLEHELDAARDRVEQRKLRRDDLLSQGGQPCQTLELLHPPVRTEEQTRAAIAELTHRLEQGEQARNNALGQQEVLGDVAALFARKEKLERELERRRQEYEAVAIALHALEKANETMQQRFSPQLNALTSQYFSRLTGGTYDRVTLNRELEGQTARTGAVLPRSERYLSRGTADQLYLAVRLAVCALCLPQHPPVVLDDALITFDDARLKLALQLLEELSGTQQILLFTCQKREGEALEELA